jgi:hypothetical protein
MGFELNSTKRDGAISSPSKKKRPDWKRRFDDPIILPDGRKLLTLRDAATYATELIAQRAAQGKAQAGTRPLVSSLQRTFTVHRLDQLSPVRS